MKRGTLTFLFLFPLIIFFSIHQSIAQKSSLYEFAKQKHGKWKLDKSKADSIANVLGIPKFYVEKDINKVVILQRLGRKNKPVYYSTNNLDVAETISVDQVWNSGNEYPSLTGEGIEINLWDGGSVRTSHQEFQYGQSSKITMRDLELPLSSHSTHIAGTMIGTGVNPAAKGMAGMATIAAWDLNDDLAEMSGAAAEGIVVSNHSYGPLCGWDYNTNNESWYWYGDPAISTTEDYEFGFYNQVSADIDHIAELAPNYLIVKSAGNDRNETPSSFEHYVWDNSWKLVNIEREPDGGIDGYDCLTPMAVAKNILAVGAVDDFSGMTHFSAFGPTDDGRIKPDVVSNGYDIFSSGSTEDNSYVTYNGTSMSAASASGSVALLNQLQNSIQPGVQLLSSTIKGILIHTASDLGNTGPDFKFGWGLLNIKNAADLIYSNSHSQGKNIYEKVLTNDEEIIIPVSTQFTPFLKVTICWTDPAGLTSNPSLNSRDRKLVNDLDILVENINTMEIYKPWILDVENPSAPATQNVNHVDNAEQIFIANPGDHNFNINITHSGSLTGGLQKFSLIVSGIETISNIYPPKNLTYTINESSIVLNWDPPDSGLPQSYKIYQNGNLLTSTGNSSFIDQSIVLDTNYEYYVTAEYEHNSQKFESLGTNHINVFPQSLRPLPFIVDFEQEANEMLYKNSLDGWQWGDSESLNCYYLDFTENTTMFIGADSYSASDATHVSDIAITAPLRLADYEDVILSFDYLLKTGIYDAIDEMHVVYKRQEEAEWHEIQNLEKAFDWTYYSIPLAPELCKNGTQIGFYYDDLYQWGMGAGLDNIQITGTLRIQEDISLESIVNPESGTCEQDDSLDLTFKIKNSGNVSISSGEVFEVLVSSNAAQKSIDYVLSQSLSIGSSITISFPNFIDPLPVGINNVSVEISWSKDESASNNSISKNITIYGLPDITFVQTPKIICIDSDHILIEANPTGGTFYGEFLADNIFNPTTADIGEHDIFYTFTDLNGCTNVDSITLTVVPLPEVSFTGLSLDYCINVPAVTLYGIPTGGSFEGSGISNDSFTPTIAGIGTHIIKYIYTDENGCSNTEEQQTIIHELTMLSFTFEEDPYCQNADPIQLTAVPAGGTFYINEEINDYLDPSQVTPGQVEIKYSFQNEYGCNSSINNTVNIIALTEVKFDDPGDPFCYTDSNLSLTAYPAGGTFYGNLVSDNIFNPVAAGIGPHEIVYIYEDNYGCQNADTVIVEVNALPEVTISGLSTICCLNGEPSQLTGLPSGGLFTGNGILGNNFFPSLAGIGTQDITYFYSDANGCSNSVDVSTTVVDSTYIEILNLQEVYCQDNDPVTVAVSPLGGILKIDGDNHNILYPNQTDPGIIEISYEFENENKCVSSVDRFIEILALPEVNIIGLSELYCQTDENYILTGNPTGGDFLLEGAPITHINPMELDNGIYELNYTYMDEYGCIGDTFKSFEISSNPTATIEGLDSYYCPNGETVTLSGVPSGGYFEGSGIVENKFTPKYLLPGIYPITYHYNHFGCDISTATSTTITEPVVVTIHNLEPEYCPDDSLVNISAIPTGGLFTINEISDDIPTFNTYEITYSYTDKYYCTFSDLQSFRVRSKPAFNFPDELTLTKDDTIYLPLENAVGSFVWPNDSTSAAIALIGAMYSRGNNVLDVTIVDNFGCFNIVSINFFIEMPMALLCDDDQSNWLIFPNPADNYLQITPLEQNISKEPSSIAIIDLNGKIINRFNDVQFQEDSFYLNTDHLCAGVYLISIQYNQSSHIQKIIVQR